MKSNIFLSFFLIGLFSITTVFGQTTSNRNNPNWNTNSHWTASAPRYDTNRSGILAHNSNVTGNPFIINNGHTITINAGVTLTTNETFTIKEGGTLIINGTLRGTGSGKEFKIEKGTLIINAGGVLDWAGYWTSDDEPSTITIDGNVMIDGDMSVKVDITGNGNIDVGGELKNDGGSIFGCTDYGNACCTGSGCYLPIELKSFTAEQTKNGIQLDWVTATEINNEFFTIERATESSDWEAIANIQGAGNSDFDISYQYLDSHHPNELTYYKLKQTDFDGSFTYSDVIVITPENLPANVRLFPNPTIDKLTVEYSTGSLEAFSIFDSYGSAVTVPVSQQSSYSTDLDVTNLSPGTYILRIEGKEKSTIYRFIKSR